MTDHVTIVVPLYNEAHRWDPAYWRTLADLPTIRWLFVDDGSTDNTSDLVSVFTDSTHTQLLSLHTNQGKGNAVRQGMLAAWENPGRGIGFLDGDGAFDPQDVQDLVARLTDSKAPGGAIADWDSVWGSRVALAGRNIHRRSSRHYIGRIIATAISQGLPGVPYDTQCGFKIFAPTQALRHSIEDPFRTRWFFDVEILQRWIAFTGQPMRIWEQPLMHWRDVPGSKITSRSAFQVAREVAFIARTNSSLSR